MGNTNTTDVFQARFGWNDDETVVNNTIISSAGVVGLTIGSFLGGSLIANGRRKTAIIAQSIAIIGSLITMIATVPFLTIGRVLCGTSAGIANVVFGKMITENMPEKTAAKYAMMHNAAICIGFLAAFPLGAILPDPDDYEANKEDEMWRVIFLAPAIIGVIVIFCVLFIFNLEPIAYCITTGRDAEGKKHMLRVYRKKDPNTPESIEEILDMQYSW